MSAATTIETATTVETTPDALALATRELEPAEALALSADVAGFITRIRTLTARAKTIVVTGRGQEHEEKAARVTRLAIRSERIEALKQLKEMKASTLRRGRAFDGVAAIVREMTEPAEEYLELQEKWTERADAADRDALRDSRRQTLVALGADPSMFADLGSMSAEAWTALHDNSVLARDAKVDAAKQEEAIRVEAERIAAERRAAEKAASVKAEAERVERERAQAEDNARLKQEAAEREESIRAEREKAAAEVQAAKAEADRIANERAEANRIAQEAAAEETRKAREETNRAARALAKAQAEAAQAKADAEQATREREAADVARVAAEAASRAPTKAKYALLVAALTAIASWEDGDDLAAMDEPSSARKAREALTAVGLAPKAGA